jgi:hypothetical protein
LIAEEPVEEALVASVPEEKEVKIHLQRISRPVDEGIEEAEKALEEAPVRDSIHIPIRRPSFEIPSRNTQPALRYVSDDAPAIPRREAASRASMIEVMPQREEDFEAAIEDAVVTEAKPKEHPAWQYVSVAALGGAVLVVVMFASIMVNTHVVKEAGKASSVQYSLQ